MSKVNRFSLEERYGYQNRKVIYDKDADNDIELNSIYPVIDLLNKYDKQISGLQKQLEEKNKEIKTYKQREYISMEQLSFVSLNVERLERKLKSQPREIIQKIKEKGQYGVFEGKVDYTITEELLDAILKEYEN